MEISRLQAMLGRPNHRLQAADIRTGLTGRAVIRFNDRERIERAGRPVTFAPGTGPRGAALGGSLGH
jgi:hypothetical protein